MASKSAQHPSTPAPQRSAGRQLLIVLAVILALLVLLCAGVISYLLRQGIVTMSAGLPAVTVAVNAEQLSATSYRLREQAPQWWAATRPGNGSGQGHPHTTEGRQRT